MDWVTQKLHQPIEIKKNNKTAAALVQFFTPRHSPTSYDVCLQPRLCARTQLDKIMHNKWRMYKTLRSELTESVLHSVTPYCTNKLSDTSKRIDFPLYLKHPLLERKKGVHYIENASQLATHWRKGNILQSAVVSDEVEERPYTLRLYLLVLDRRSVFLFQDGIMRIAIAREAKIIDACQKRLFSSHPEYAPLFSNVTALLSSVMSVFARYAPERFDRHQKFPLYGVDLVVDVEKKPWLLEINMGPAMDRDECLSFRRRLLDDAFEILRSYNGSGVKLDDTSFVRLCEEEGRE